MNAGIVGYTAGVFDLFHIGHLNILRESKRYCDYLIVAVSTDSLVADYKNRIPAIPFVQRLEIVNSVRYVDKVVVQTNRDKIDAFLKYQFDVLFVGDDWKDDEVFSSVHVFMEQRGAIGVKYLPYTKGISSTLLREQAAREQPSCRR